MNCLGLDIFADFQDRKRNVKVIKWRAYEYKNYIHTHNKNTYFNILYHFMTYLVILWTMRMVDCFKTLSVVLLLQSIYSYTQYIYYDFIVCKHLFTGGIFFIKIIFNNILAWNTGYVWISFFSYIFQFILKKVLCRSYGIMDLRSPTVKS